MNLRDKEYEYLFSVVCNLQEISLNERSKLIDTISAIQYDNDESEEE